MFTWVVLYVRSSAALVLPILVDIVVPAALLQGSGGSVELNASLLGLLPMAGGTWLLLDSVFARFAHEGRGTLAPIDPPRFLVAGGAYRVVRNPMYVANVAIILGTAVLFASWPLAGWAAVAFAAFHLFVVGYEEPNLRQRFGASYEDYLNTVGRWWPKRRQR